MNVQAVTEVSSVSIDRSSSLLAMRYRGAGLRQDPESSALTMGDGAAADIVSPDDDESRLIECGSGPEIHRKRQTKKALMSLEE